MLGKPASPEFSPSATSAQVRSSGSPPRSARAPSSCRRCTNTSRGANPLDLTVAHASVSLAPCHHATGVLVRAAQPLDSTGAVDLRLRNKAGPDGQYGELNAVGAVGLVSRLPVGATREASTRPAAIGLRERPHWPNCVAQPAARVRLHLRPTYPGSARDRPGWTVRHSAGSAAPRRCLDHAAAESGLLIGSSCRARRCCSALVCSCRLAWCRWRLP